MCIQTGRDEYSRAVCVWFVRVIYDLWWSLRANLSPGPVGGTSPSLSKCRWGKKPFPSPSSPSSSCRMSDRLTHDHPFKRDVSGEEELLEDRRVFSLNQSVGTRKARGVAVFVCLRANLFACMPCTLWFRGVQVVSLIISNFQAFSLTFSIIFSHHAYYAYYAYFFRI